MQPWYRRCTKGLPKAKESPLIVLLRGVAALGLKGSGDEGTALAAYERRFQKGDMLTLRQCLREQAKAPANPYPKP